MLCVNFIGFISPIHLLIQNKTDTEEKRKDRNKFAHSFHTIVVVTDDASSKKKKEKRKIIFRKILIKYYFFCYNVPTNFIINIIFKIEISMAGTMSGIRISFSGLDNNCQLCNETSI